VPCRVGRKQAGSAALVLRYKRLNLIVGGVVILHPKCPCAVFLAVVVKARHTVFRQSELVDKRSCCRVSARVKPIRTRVGKTNDIRFRERDPLVDLIESDVKGNRLSEATQFATECSREAKALLPINSDEHSATTASPIAT